MCPIPQEADDKIQSCNEVTQPSKGEQQPGRLRLNKEELATPTPQIPTQVAKRMLLTPGLVNVDDAKVVPQVTDGISAQSSQAQAKDDEELVRLRLSGSARVTATHPNPSERPASNRMRLGVHASGRLTMSPGQIMPEPESLHEDITEGTTDEVHDQQELVKLRTGLRSGRADYAQTIHPTAAAPSHAAPYMSEVVGSCIWKLGPLIFFTVLLSGAAGLNSVMAGKSNDAKGRSFDRDGELDKSIRIAAVESLRQRKVAEVDV